MQSSRSLSNTLREKFAPRKTHILVEANFGLLSIIPEQPSDILMSLSASLPGQITVTSDGVKKLDPVFKTDARSQRVEIMKVHTGRSAKDLTEYARRGNPSVKGWFDIGNCAETLTYAR